MDPDSPTSPDATAPPPGVEARAPSLPAPPLLALERVGKRIGPVAIFRGLELRVERRQTVAVLGARCSGKTLLLRAAAGLTNVDTGTIAVEGVSIAKDAAKQRVGFMPRPPGRPGGGETRVLTKLKSTGGVFPATTVLEDLEFFAACLGVPAGKRPALIGDVLALMDLSECSGERADRLSFGRQAKLFFARAILRNPDLLLLDDPCPAFSGNPAEFWEILRELKGMGKGILLTGSDPAAFREGPDRIAVLYGGNLKDEGAPGEVLARVRAAGWPPPPMLFGGLIDSHPGGPPRPAPAEPAAPPAGPPIRYPPAPRVRGAPVSQGPALAVPTPAAAVGPTSVGPCENPRGAPVSQGPALAGPTPPAPARAKEKGGSAGAAFPGVGRILSRLPGPVFWNEMRHAFFRGRSTGWVLGGVAALCAVVFVAGSAAWFGKLVNEQDPPGRRLFFACSLAILGALFAAGPAWSAGAFIAEKDRRTFDLLLCSGLGSLEIVAGKLAAAFARTFACFLAGLPCLLVAYALGGVGTWDVVKHVVFFGSWIAMETAAGVALSMFFRSYALTLLATYLAVFLVFLATVTISLFTYSLFTLAAGLPWVGFWAVSSAVNGTIFIVLLGGALLLFGPLARWDY